MVTAQVQRVKYGKRIPDCAALCAHQIRQPEAEMDQSVEPKRADRAQAVARLCDFIATSIDRARAVEGPFYHLQLERVFPDDVYASMLTAMPEASDYRPLYGQNRCNVLADGTPTRVKIDLFPEYIRHLPAEKRVIWDIVGRALCSKPVKAAFVRKLAPALERRFGRYYANLGMYPNGWAAKTNNFPLSELQPSPHFEVLVTASGGYGERVEQASEVRPALQRALRAVQRAAKEMLP